MKSLLYAGVLVLAVVAQAGAQDRSVSRRQFTFLDNTLTVEVLAEIPGTLQVIRGEQGMIDVAGRSPGGMTAFALGGREGNNLRLTAVGGDQADFIVVVPEDAYVRVRMPGRKAGELGSTRPSGTFSWGGANVARRVASPAALPAPAGPAIAHLADHAPRLLSIPKMTTVRTVTVRIEGNQFAIAGDRYMSVANGSTQHVEIRTGDEAQQLVITVPYGTQDFTLKLGGRTALSMRGIAITSYCEPVTEQTFGDGRRYFTFAPEAGRLSCR